MDALKMKLAVLDHARGAHAGALLNFIPDLNSPWMPMITFFVYISLNWWATWYPGAEPGGGGYIAQRMFSAKDEKNSLLATLWFNIAHFALRPWPWILVALASLVLFPGLARSRKRVRPRDDRVSSGFAARRDAGGVRRRLHVHHRDAAELGRQLRGERFLPPLRPAAGATTVTTCWFRNGPRCC